MNMSYIFALYANEMWMSKTSIHLLVNGNEDENAEKIERIND